MDIDSCKELDKKNNLIPIYFKPVYKKLFYKREFIKKFLILELELDKSLEKQNSFYGKSVIYNNYAPFVVKTSVVINIDGGKIPFTFTKIDHKNKYKKNKLYELNLIIGKPSGTKIKEREDFKKIKKNINYYRNLYEKGVELDKKSLLLVIMTSKSYKEIYEILIKIFDKKETTNIIRLIHQTTTNVQVIKKWKKYQDSKTKINYWQKQIFKL